MTLLRDLENQNDIKILMAVNYGSHSFGYASAESDWDVRFIYVHRPEWYFSIVKEEDTIEMMLEEEHLINRKRSGALTFTVERERII